MLNIIKSGSLGNCYHYKNITIDIGVPIKLLDGLEIDHVLLTHIHGDHFNTATIINLFAAKQSIKFYCGEFLYDKLVGMLIPANNIVVIEPNKIYNVGDIKISPFNLYHNVPNFGYRIVHGKHKHFHATDTKTLKGLTAKNYSSCTIECNYDADIIDSLIEEKELLGEFSHLKRAKLTHLSVQEAIKFVKDNNIKDFTPAHIGSKYKEEVLKVLERINDDKPRQL